MLNKLIVLAVLLLPACFANAHEYKAGELEIAHPWSQELPPNAPTVAAYFVIHNNGKTTDRLLSVDSPIAGVAQLHEHVMQNDLMKNAASAQRRDSGWRRSYFRTNGVSRDAAGIERPQPVERRQTLPADDALREIRRCNGRGRGAEKKRLKACKSTCTPSNRPS